MNKSDLILLYDYSQWANGRLVEAAAKLTPEQFAAPYPATYGSLRGMLVHILVSYSVWLGRCRDGSMPSSFPEHAEFPDVAALAWRFLAKQTELRAYLETLSEADLQRKVSYTTSKGVAYENTLWHIIVHVFNHATQHRSEAAEALTAYNCSPGDLDFIWYLRQLQG